MVEYARKKSSRIFQIRKAEKQRNSHVHVKTQQIIISQAFKIIICDTEVSGFLPKFPVVKITGLHATHLL